MIKKIRIKKNYVKIFENVTIIQFFSSRNKNTIEISNIIITIVKFVVFFVVELIIDIIVEIIV